MAGAEVLINLKTGEVYAAKPPGSPWGRRELRPAKGKAREWIIIESDEEEIVAKVAKGVALFPLADGEERSKKRVDVEKLSAAIKAQVNDPKRSGKVGRVLLEAKSKRSKP